MKPVYVEGALYTIIAVATPIAALLSGNQPITGRTITAVSIGALIAGCTALKAFLSTSYSRATGDAILVRDDAVPQ